MNTNFNELALSIIEKAVTDYKLLLELNVKEIEFCDEGRISKVELEDFSVASGAIFFFAA